MLSSQNVVIVKIPFRSKVMPFLTIAYCFVLMGKKIFDWQQWYTTCIGDPLTLRHEPTISCEEMHTLIMVSISMASNTVDGLYINL